MSDKEALETKVVILGSAFVGKTSMVEQFIYQRFSERTQATIGGAFVKKTLIVKRRPVSLQVWDTAGQERFRSMAPMYYRGAHAAILVFDCTTPESLRECQSFADELSLHADDDIILVIAANKIDLRAERKEKAIAVVDKPQAAAFARQMGGRLFETSAKTGQGIGALFQFVASELVKADGKKRKAARSSRPQHADIFTDPTPKDEGCC